MEDCGEEFSNNCNFGYIFGKLRKSKQIEIMDPYKGKSRKSAKLGDDQYYLRLKFKVSERRGVTKSQVTLEANGKSTILKPSEGAKKTVSNMRSSRKNRKRVPKDHYSEEDADSMESDSEDGDADNEHSDESEGSISEEEEESEPESLEPESQSEEEEKAPPAKRQNARTSKYKKDGTLKRKPGPKPGSTKRKGAPKRQTRKRQPANRKRRNKKIVPLNVESEEEGAKTEEDQEDFVNKDISSSEMSQLSEPSEMSKVSEQDESQEDLASDEGVEELNKKIKEQTKKDIFVIENNNEGLEDSNESESEEEQMLEVKTNNRRNKIRREGISRGVGYGGAPQGVEETPIVFSNPYDMLLSRLQLNFIPEALPCREKEKTIIRDFIKSGLRNRGSSTSLYISGMPGTGKTATTLEVIRSLQNDKSGKKFQFIHINGMQLNNSSVMYTLIHKEITGVKQKPTSAAVSLDAYFKKRKDLSERNLKNQKMIVLLVDELDALVTKKQTLLYNLFDWPSNKNSGLIILAIANTMDLPERFLVKIKSRIGESRLVYQPYNLSQIKQIIMSRLHGKALKEMLDPVSLTSFFPQNSIEIVSKKVSSLSGDIRRALQVCRRATEMAKADNTKVEKGELKLKDFNKNSKNEKNEVVNIGMSHIQKAFLELYNSKTTLLLKALRKYEKLIIIAIGIESSKSTLDKVKLSDVTNRINGMSSKLNYDSLKQGEIMEILLKLKSFGIITITNEKPNQIKLDNMHIQTFVYPEELSSAYDEECDIYSAFKDMLDTV